MYEVQKTEEFDVWLSALRDQVGKAKIIARIRRLELGKVMSATSVKVSANYGSTSAPVIGSTTSGPAG